MAPFQNSLVWFRRDLRLYDHTALHQALTQSRNVFCTFVFDKDILEGLPRADRRVEFIHACLDELDKELRTQGSQLIVLHDTAQQAIPRLAARLKIDAVFVNRDYEPAAVDRDARISRSLQESGCRFFSYKDQVIFEKDEVLSLSGKAFSVFTPYKKAWLKKLQSEPYDPERHSALAPYAVEPHTERFAKLDKDTLPGLPGLMALGFRKTGLSSLYVPAGSSGAATLLEGFSEKMQRYHRDREFPAIEGSSRLSVHLRFGTISIRAATRHAVESMMAGNGLQETSGPVTWLSELIWRDFYSMVLHHRPDIVTRSFKPEYDRIAWESGPDADRAFKAWCEGETGYPLIDAAMRQLNGTGYMHNRLRMVTACFLVKDLGIDWRLGERYFARQLIDYDLASNNGGWQWAASTGCDAQPYFRIFNPVTQSQKFDAQGNFIRRYLPVLRNLDDRQIHAPWLPGKRQLESVGLRLGKDYPMPIVDHAQARLRTLERYAVVKKQAMKEG